jgi:hypothetical protein
MIGDQSTMKVLAVKIQVIRKFQLFGGFLGLLAFFFTFKIVQPGKGRASERF